MSDVLTYVLSKYGEEPNQLQIDSANPTYNKFAEFDATSDTYASVNPSHVIANTATLHELIKFPKPNTADATYKQIVSAVLTAGVFYASYAELSRAPQATVYPLMSNFTKNTTWSDKPDFAAAAATVTVNNYTYGGATTDGAYSHYHPSTSFTLTPLAAAYIARYGCALKQNTSYAGRTYIWEGTYLAGYVNYQFSRSSSRVWVTQQATLTLNYSSSYALPNVNGTYPERNDTVYRGADVTFRGIATDPVLTALPMQLKAKIAIYNSNKQLVSFDTSYPGYNSFVNVEDGKEFTVTINTKTLPAGDYYYKVTATNNGNSSTIAETDYIPFEVKVGTTLKYSTVSPASGGSFYGSVQSYLTFNFSQDKSSTKAPDIGVSSASVVFASVTNPTDTMTIPANLISYDGAKFTVSIPPMTLKPGTYSVTASGKDTIDGSWSLPRAVQFTVNYPTLSVQSTSPSSGSEIDKNNANTFGAIFARPGDNVGGSYIYGKNAVFVYRENGATSENTVPPTTAHLTATPITVEAVLPSGTFSAKRYECKWKITDNLDRIVESSWTGFTAKDLSLSFASISPENGARLDRKVDNSFTITMQANAEVAGLDLTIGTATLSYRKQGRTNTTNVTGSINGLSADAIIAAGRLDNDDYEYRWSVVDNKGKTVTSDWLAITTRDAIPVTSAYSPNGILISDKLPITFRWIHDTATGSAQTEAELYRSPDGVSWSRFAHVESAETSYTVDAGTFANGEWYWRVRSANLDGTFGEYSEPAKFTVIGSPAAPIITVTNTVGRPTIKWQSPEQEAYEITLDERPPVMYRGTNKSWISPEYLPDGEHTISVRVQNKYNLWSAPGIAIITVTHTEGAAIIADAASERSVRLTWSSSGYDYYIVYRDGKPICKTQLGVYEDRYSIGECVYQIRGCYNSNYNYGLSAELPVTCDPPDPCICEVGGEWLDLALCDTQHRAYKVSRAASIQHLRLAGRTYPTPVNSIARTLAISLDFAVPKGESKKQIKGLLGKVCCLKIPDGEMVIGPVSALDTSYEAFYSVWSVSVEQSDFTDEVRLDA